VDAGLVAGAVMYPARADFFNWLYTFLVNFLYLQLSYQRATYMKTTEQIPKKTNLRSKQKTLTDKCQWPGINLLREVAKQKRLQQRSLFQ
jgi:hypothetical protein